MRVILPESGRQRKRRFGGTSASVVLHAVIIGGAVAASGLRAEAPPRRAAPPPLVYVQRADDRAPRPRPPVEHPAPAAPRTLRPPDVPLLPSIEPLVIAETRIVPGEMPPIDVRLGAVAAGVAPTVTGASSGDSSGGPRGDVGSGARDAPFTARTVEREVRLLGAVTLRYPAMLQGAGIEGEVLLQYVVDTLGRVEKGSIRAVRRDHALFERSARDAVLQSRFTPAEAGGRRVRQLIEQRFVFEIR